MTRQISLTLQRIGSFLLLAALPVSALVAAPTCRDPWVTAALTSMGKGGPSDTKENGLCSVRRYRAATWSNQPELNDLVKQSFYCDHPWIGQIYAEAAMGYSKPQGSGSSGQCSPSLYGASAWDSSASLYGTPQWNASAELAKYNDLKRAILAYKNRPQPAPAPPPPTPPPAPPTTPPANAGLVIRQLHDYSPGSSQAMFVIDDSGNAWRFLPSAVQVTDAGGGAVNVTLPSNGPTMRVDTLTLSVQGAGRIVAAGAGAIVTAGNGTWRPDPSAIVLTDQAAMLKLAARMLPKPAVATPPPSPAPAPVPIPLPKPAPVPAPIAGNSSSGPSCQDPNVTAALKALGKGTAADTGTGGLCSTTRYHEGKWSNTPELNDLVKQSFLCTNPWIGEIYAESAMGYSKPNGSGTSGDCDPTQYGKGTFSGYDDLRTKVLATYSHVTIKIIPSQLILAPGQKGTFTVTVTPDTPGALTSRIPMLL